MKSFLLILIAAFCFADTEVRLPDSEYAAIRKAENARNAAARVAALTRRDHPDYKARMQAVQDTKAEYGRVFQEVEAKHTGYKLQPERLVLIKIP